jgi:hypothetical protein
VDAYNEVGSEVKADKTEFMLMPSRHQNPGQGHNIKTADGSFENVARFKYFGTTVTNQN